MAPESAAAGWYGKLPVLGDFASRRLPQGLITAWDAWLQHGMSYSQEHLAAAWLDSYLSAPVWRFVLGERTLDTQLWAGIVLPSVDRVGRYFPLTLCAALPAFSFSAGALAALDEWMFALEEVARSGLDPQIAVEDFDARLAACPLPLIHSSPASVFGEALARGDIFIPLAAPGAGGLPALLGDVAGTASRTLFAHNSLWWCANPDGATGGFACHGMPSAAVFASMLQYSPAAP
jgi:type VI secretion system protein ImpM